MSATTGHNALYHWLKPFLQQLRGKGFIITPDTHMQLQRVLYAFYDQITDANILQYISPVLAKNSAQYTLLRAEFELFLETGETPVINTTIFTPVPQPRTPVQPQHKHALKKWWRLIPDSLSLLLIAILLFFALQPRAIKALFTIPPSITRNNNVTLDALPGFQQPADTQYAQCQWNLGDGSPAITGPRVTHHYTQPGTYPVSLHVTTKNKRVKLLQPVLQDTLVVCPEMPAIVSDAGERVAPGTTVHFSLQYDTLYPPPINNAWTINDEEIAHNSTTFTYTFQTAGSYRIGCNQLDSSYHTCWMVTRTNIKVGSDEAYTASLQQQGPLLIPPVRINPWWSALLGIALTFLLIRSLLSGYKYLREQRSRIVLVKRLLKTFSGDAPPYDIPISSQQHVIEEESGLQEVLKSVKQRIVSDIRQLNIPATIRATIHSEGLIAPVYSQRSRPLEYLLLIDKSRARNKQVQLFEYLMNRFAKNDVYFEKFYFTGTPAICVNNSYPNGISIAKLYDRYADHILIIFGAGHQLIDDYSPLPNALGAFCSKWPQWAIVTPVPYKDWTFKEKLLAKTAVILPADLEGMLLLLPVLLNPSLDLKAQLKQIDTSARYKFKDADQLAAYLQDPFLFQWICAMAVFPLIHWDMMLALGDAVQQASFPRSNIDYSALLRLVRIDWMQQGSFPDNTRLELLKQLTPANEIAARSTVIRLMNEAAAHLPKDSAAYEDIVMQRIINQFMLYAYDPKAFKEHYEGYKQFLALWQLGKVKDYPFSAYIQPDTEGISWPTLISEGDHTQTVNDQLHDRPHAKQGRQLRQWASIAALVLLGWLAIFFFRESLNNTKLNKWLGLVTGGAGATVLLNINVLPSLCTDSMGRLPDGTSLQFSVNDGQIYRYAGRPLQMSVDPISLQQYGLTASLKCSTGFCNFDTLFADIGQRQLNITIEGCRPTTNTFTCGDWNEVKRGVPQALQGEWFPDDFRNARYNNKTDGFSPTTIGNNNIDKNAMQNVYQCSNNPQLYKVITQSAEHSFPVYYILTNTAGNEAWMVSPDAPDGNIYDNDIAVDPATADHLAAFTVVSSRDITQQQYAQALSATGINGRTFLSHTKKFEFRNGSILMDDQPLNISKISFVRTSIIDSMWVITLTNTQSLKFIFQTGGRRCYISGINVDMYAAEDFVLYREASLLNPPLNPPDTARADTTQTISGPPQAPPVDAPFEDKPDPLDSYKSPDKIYFDDTSTTIARSQRSKIMRPTGKNSAVFLYAGNETGAQKHLNMVRDALYAIGTGASSIHIYQNPPQAAGPTRSDFYPYIYIKYIDPTAVFSGYDKALSEINEEVFSLSMDDRIIITFINAMQSYGIPLPNLETLSLRNSKTDNVFSAVNEVYQLGLKLRLFDLRKLKTLDLRQNAVKQTDIDMLKKTLPNTDILFDQPQQDKQSLDTSKQPQQLQQQLYQQQQQQTKPPQTQQQQTEPIKKSPRRATSKRPARDSTTKN